MSIWESLEYIERVRLIAGLFIMFILTPAQMWGLVLQKQSIKFKKTGTSVSLMFFVTSVVYYTLIAIYGFFLHEVPMLFNGLLAGPMFIPVALALSKHKRFKTWDKIFSWVFVLFIPLMFVLEDKGLVFLIAGFLRAIPFSDKSYQLLKEKKVGAAEIRLFAIFLSGCIFWIIYSHALNNIYLIVMSYIYTTILLATNSLWVFYWLKEKNSKKNIIP